MSQNALTTMRDRAPLIHNITNYVAMNVAANVLLAAGASPAMLHAEEEAGEFAAVADALTVNIGTLSPAWVRGMNRAIAAANDKGTPWVLDPVAHFATPYRAAVAQDLMQLNPAILRGNASEILSLAGGVAGGKGADSGDSVRDAQSSAIALAQAKRCVVVITGPVDFVTDGTRIAEVSGGDPMMPKITALGCSLTALMGAYAAVLPALDAAVAALAHFAEAGLQAGQTARGPGSFQVAFLDALAAADETSLPDGKHVTWR